MKAGLARDEVLYNSKLLELFGSAPSSDAAPTSAEVARSE